MSTKTPTPPPPRSSDFTRFVESVKGVSADWRETVDTEALLRLEKDERRAAIDLLIEQLELDDWRAPPALVAAVGRGGVMPMKRRLPLCSGRMKISIARALVAFGTIPRTDDIVAEVLRSGDPDGGLVALSEAEELRSVEIRDALAWSCLHHPSPEVRGNAGAVLYYFSGLAEDALAWNFRPFWLPLTEEDPAVRKLAFEEICQHVGMPPDIAG
ncbi:MAG: hypothetical protein ABJE95_09540 [Byssovorax sp.]